jgi:hypothetical protein
MNAARLVSIRRILIAGWIGIVSAACRSISSVSSISRGADGSSSNAYRYPTAHGRTSIDTAAISSTMINTGASDAGARPVSEGVSRNSHETPDADDHGCSERNNGST